MNPQPHAVRRTLIALAAAVAALAASATAQAQMITDAMIQQRMQAMNNIVQQAQNGVAQIVQRRMQDPQVQMAWQQYVAQQGGRPQMDYPTFTYYYVYTNGFSSGGMAHMRANEAGIAQRERESVQGLRDAEANRAAAMQAQRDGYFRHQQEAGLGLRGQSTFVAPNGAAVALPHTWQRNTIQSWQGNTYRVDESGQYFVLAANGWWYPLQGQR